MNSEKRKQCVELYMNFEKSVEKTIKLNQPNKLLEIL